MRGQIKFRKENIQVEILCTMVEKRTKGTIVTITTTVITTSTTY